MADRIDVDVDVDGAVRALDGAADGIDQGAKRAIRQLSVLQENAQKRNAPEGAGRGLSLRDSIDTRFSRGGLTANIGARKRASDGVLLAKYVTGSPSYSPENPPPPLFDWAAAKLGDRSLGWAVAQAIANRGGQLSFPNPYVRDAYVQWRGDVDDVVTDEVQAAMSRLGGT